MMSSTGNRWVGFPTFKAFGVLLGTPPRSRDAAIERAIKTFGVIGSPAYPFDEERLRRIAGTAYDRGHSATGVARQLHAITASGDRTRGLRQLKLPATVIHGDSDVLVRPSGGKATAKAIPGARLKIIGGMGHDLPKELWPTFVTEIAGTAARVATVEQPARSG
jgi:pimeloyl-ACP methyl ester carboxylesterase